ncbi:hypothetical protein VZT92_014112 [Zoarces viviparus]|uniref:Uncharacterized protein n=1 Tax=Zoarces viviparus TaxID=48416 RepID=A0AAW1EYH6_ZOAVI
MLSFLLRPLTSSAVHRERGIPGPHSAPSDATNEHEEARSQGSMFSAATRRSGCPGLTGCPASPACTAALLRLSG